MEALVKTVTSLITLIVGQFFTATTAATVWGVISGTGTMTLSDVMLGSFVFSLAVDKSISLLFGARRFSR